MTPAGLLLAEEIRREGPVPFSRFMDVALYHPEHGYYRRARDPFGAGGDFFTAEQIQPVFGTLMAARIRQLYRDMGEPPDFTVVELGAGREEMASAFAEWRYVAVDVDRGVLPERFRGVVFCNEFFDALPVDVAVYRGGQFLEQRVAFAGGRFQWQTGVAVNEELAAYFRRYWAPPEEDRRYEAGSKVLSWLARIAAALEDGYLFTIDYGFTRAESIRFPDGTLMGYRRHRAHDDVLIDPGERDITAHVNFSALQEAGADRGLRTERFETLAQTLLAAGEADRFRAAIGSGGPAEELRLRMQLKTLLFGMGETFRVLLQRRER
ncbi:MAG TPA: SAM-dependent methyltransferase [Candidatus Acidoferrales bacterium]|nr:SAM-dependent methyltransferase [Candidatus Acidoferrales bacterium]